MKYDPRIVREVVSAAKLDIDTHTATKLCARRRR